MPHHLVMLYLSMKFHFEISLEGNFLIVKLIQIAWKIITGKELQMYATLHT